MDLAAVVYCKHPGNVKPLVRSGENRGPQLGTFLNNTLGFCSVSAAGFCGWGRVRVRVTLGVGLGLRVCLDPTIGSGSWPGNVSDS